MGQRCYVIRLHLGYHKFIVWGKLLWLCLLMVACQPQNSSNPTPVSVPATATSVVTPVPIQSTAEIATMIAQSNLLESYQEPIRRAIIEGDFGIIFSGQYLDWEVTKNVVLVTEQVEAVQQYLTERGIPEDVVEVRSVDYTIQELQATEDLLWEWIETDFRSGAGVTINVPKNKVELSLDTTQLIEILGFDPGAEIIPYEKFPASLQEKLQASYSQVEVRAGFFVSPSNS